MPLARWPVAAIVCCLAAPLLAGPPRDELLRLVPDDAALVWLAQDARPHLDRLLASPFARRIVASPLGQGMLRSPEWSKLAGVQGDLETALGLSARELRDDILGDAVAVSYTPGPPGREDADEEGLLLLWARDPARLTTLVARIDTLQREAGELARVESRQHAGQAYNRRVKKREGDRDDFYAVRGNVLAFSNHERAVQRVLERSTTTAPPRLLERLTQLGVEAKPLVWWLNPRAFDPALQRQVKQAKPEEAAFLRTFQVYWSALEGAALFADFDRDLQVGVAVRANPAALPASARRFLAEAGEPCGLWSSFPPDALATVAVRLAPEHLLPALGDFLTPDARAGVKEGIDRSVTATLGPDTLVEALERVGPELGVCVGRPLAGGTLPSITAAVRLRPDPRQPGDEVRLLGALNFLARVLVLAHNGQKGEPIRLMTVKQGEIEVTHLAGDKVLPPGLQPAYAFKGGYLVFGSTPAEIGRFQPPTVAPADPGLLARVDLSAVAAHLRQHRQTLTGMAGNDVEGAIVLGELLGVVELRQRSGAAGTLTLMLRLAPAEPLRP